MSEIPTKDLISKFKDYADIADASYAMLHWINENEEDGWFDKFKDEPPARWKFKDSITKSFYLLILTQKLTSLKI